MAKPLSSRQNLVLQLLVLAVFLNGVLTVLSTLANRVVVHGEGSNTSVDIWVHLIIGLSFVYLAMLLRRRKWTAWALAVPLFVFLTGLNITEHFLFRHHPSFNLVAFFRNVIFPATIASLLLIYRHEFEVKSDIRSFTQAIKTSLVVLAVALMYGVIGFQLLDTHDFRHEISVSESVHRTVDQFDFTTDKALVPYTKRAKLFVDSLSVISVGAVAYSIFSLFQPLRWRLIDQSEQRAEMERLLEASPHSSEDFFKLWPHDKNYFFTPQHKTGLAYHVQRGVALCVGDPTGKSSRLMEGFLEFCRLNDWLPAFIHTEPKYSDFYKEHDFSIQKIGEEAIVNLDHFKTEVGQNKYFRNITNKFNREGYVAEVLTPPHNDAILRRLKEVSDDWLALPGRDERGLMMGFFNAEYMQLCPVMVLRDAAGTIQAFINQIPSFDPEEANYDLLRYTQNALGNANDFLLTNFINYLSEAGFKRLNLGLCPLAGLDKDDSDQGVIDNLLGFVYSNGDRFYSFSGLRRFKAKYEPEWSGRYVAYRGGIRGFTRTMYALNKAMSHTSRR